MWSSSGLRITSRLSLTNDLINTFYENSVELNRKHKITCEVNNDDKATYKSDELEILVFEPGKLFMTFTNYSFTLFVHMQTYNNLRLRCFN